MTALTNHPLEAISNDSDTQNGINELLQIQKAFKQPNSGLFMPVQRKEARDGKSILIKASPRFGILRTITDSKLRNSTARWNCGGNYTRRQTILKSFSRSFTNKVNLGNYYTELTRKRVFFLLLSF